MPRYIDADKYIAYKKQVCKKCQYVCETEVSVCLIKKQMDEINDRPTEDVAPVRHAHWYHDGSEWKYRYVCSNCGLRTLGKAPSDMPYCMRCGSRMDEKCEQDTKQKCGIIIP